MSPGRGVELLLDSTHTNWSSKVISRLWALGGHSQVAQAGLGFVFFTNGLVLEILILTAYLKSVISPSVIPS